jgi:type II secretory pathway component GspD/PulD (secretin)
VFAPKVTLFVGQTAEIADTSQSPFVTDVIEQAGDKGVAYQPVIQVFWEGTRIQLNPTKTSDGHHVKCRFMFASIDDCKTFRSPSYPDADVRIQHPVISTANFECSVDIPHGQTLLIGGLFPRQVEQEGESSVLGRLLRLSPPKIARAQVTYIAVTPRAVWPSTEASETEQRESSE